MSSFRGLGILCFYSNDFFQGHVIDRTTNDSPFSLAGKLSNHVDPNHHECMDLPDFYNVLIQKHNTSTTLALVVRRAKDNDAAGLSTHEHEAELNNGHQLSFITHQFLTGTQAYVMQSKYFNRHEQDVTVCIGEIVLTEEIQS
ncbi:uncharacterized protein EV154DRAFT_592491 [Mucor mucedo]|uniref:uncharacterized protein n=1 Tax=Mucor mucedo TaxID=29922 RepID=UPI00222045F9|nr:uncharacterized protein EV154DRAFT_592491 [Mucor mucedo]KAI7889203.1 hypothetical protein EV154DRAFT_592491 [Mucor mucedo]